MHPTNQNVCRKNVNIKRTCVGIAVIPEGLPKKHRIIFGVTFNLFSQLFTHFDMTERTITDNINQIAGPGAIQLPVKAAKD
jgi:hypothetical protein